MLLNKLSLFQDIFRANILTPKYPYKATFALTYACNLKCKYCRIWQRASKNELSYKDIKMALSLMDNIKWLQLSGGEIFTREDIDYILNDIIESKNIAILTFPTNGKLSEKIINIVTGLSEKNSGKKIIVTVSIDGPKEIHDKLRGENGSYDNAMNTFKNLRKLKNITTYISATINEDNCNVLNGWVNDIAAEIHGFKDNEINYNLAVKSFFYNNAGLGNNNAVPDKNVYKAFQKLLPKFKFYKLKSYLEYTYAKLLSEYYNKIKSPVKCSAIRGTCFIDPCGDVYPCIMYNKKLGNIIECEYSLKYFWKAKFKQRIAVRQQIGRNECKGCWTVCDGYSSILENMLSLSTYLR